MIRYIAHESCIEDRIKHQFIPKNKKNKDYKLYLKWVEEGNLPVSTKPSDDYVLIDDEWVLDEKLREILLLDELVTLELREMALKNIELKEKL